MFCKRKKPNENRVSKSEGIKDKTAKKVAAAISSAQNGFAGFMNKWVNQLNVRGRKIFAIAFCLVFGGGSVFIIIITFIGNETKTVKALTPESLSIPKHFDKAGDENSATTLIVSESEFEKIQHFRRYMDSLQKSQSGKKVYDSIIKVRPGLLDSVRMLEQIYFIQKQNK